MAPIRIDSSHFSPDTCAFLESLAGAAVRYLIVGGEAVILHGHVRLTGDVDFFFARDRENLIRLFSALEEFWAGDVPGIGSPEELSTPGLVVQFGQPPNRIDLLNEIDGVTFDEAWPGRVEAVVQTEAGDVPLTFIGRDARAQQTGEWAAEGSGRPRLPHPVIGYARVSTGR